MSAYAISATYLDSVGNGMLGLRLVAFDTRQAMQVVSVDVVLMCRCQGKLELKWLRLAVRRW